MGLEGLADQEVVEEEVVENCQETSSFRRNAKRKGDHAWDALVAVVV